MVAELSWESVLTWRMERQRIARRAQPPRWLGVVRRICGLHAQVRSSAEPWRASGVTGTRPRA